MVGQIGVRKILLSWLFALLVILPACNARTSTDDLLSTEGIDIAPNFEVISVTMSVGEQRTFTVKGGKLPLSAKVLGKGTVTVQGRNCTFTAPSLIDTSSIVITDARGKQATLSIDAIGVETLPTAISGLALWLKADAMSYADGVQISGWIDSSGNGRDFTVGTMPTFASSFVNGLPALTFNGGQHAERAFNSALNSTAFTLFVFHYPASTAAGNCAFSSRDGQTNAGTGTLRGYWLCAGGGNLSQVAFGNGTLSNVWNYMYAVSVLTTNTWFLSEVRVDSQTYGLWQNAVQQSLASRVAVPYTEVQSAAYSTRVGATGDGTAINYYNGKMAEIILYDRALTSAEVQGIRCYLKRKYALSFGC